MLLSAISSNINNNRDSAYIWDEEIKCLFLRARFSLATCIDEFVKKIFGYPPYSKEGTEIRTKTKNILSDFWHRLNQSVL
ncbi:19113_t:CDS:2, partial [Dentiscutata erythropus]